VNDWAYYYRVKAIMPERYRQVCRLLTWGKLNGRLIEFHDGTRVITNGNYIRRRKPGDYGYRW
jgi:hypothetical protein